METRLNPTLCLRRKLVFELPMRDGNMRLDTDEVTLEYSFWTSYEGWKHGELCSFTFLPFGFWTSYEGWKQGRRLVVFYWMPVFELPMRDGNRRKSSDLPGVSIVFELPMRDGNTHMRYISAHSGSTFLNFLWGMETKPLQAVWPDPAMVFELPMRDGNSDPVWTTEVQDLVFELPMRDGNKHLAGRQSANRQVFELPMRDGNSSPVCVYANVDAVFELPMRDGNSPRTTDASEPPSPVFELPMRDGNAAHAQTFRCLHRVFELPMRDGNGCKNLSFETTHRQFLNFLWGMETFHKDLLSSISLSCFWTSYEGWKQKCAGAMNELLEVFELPMRDGNITSAPSGVILYAVFELPMRDGNCAVGRRSHWRRPGFWTSYEGWKPVFLFVIFKHYVSFLNFLWGMETPKSITIL